MQPAEPLPARIKLFDESVAREIEALLRAPRSARAQPSAATMAAAAQPRTEGPDAAVALPADPLLSAAHEPAANGESDHDLPAIAPVAESAVPPVENGTPALPSERPAAELGDNDLLPQLANRVRMIQAADGRIYAAASADGRTEYYRLESREFRRYLLCLYHEATGAFPGQIALAKVMAALQNRAEITNRVEPVFLRVAHEPSGKGFLIDLGDPARRAVHVTDSGWAVVDNPGVPFWRPPGQRAFPTPVKGGAIDRLRAYMNLPRRQWPLVLGWLTAALRPDGPYPLLVITGEQGSAKSTLAQICRRLVDPSASLLRALPPTQRDLMVSAHNNWLLAYDNISSLRPWQSDALCRLASGGGFAARSLYTDDRETILTAQRPAILNGIDDFVTRGDLIDRSIFIALPRILSKERYSDQKFWAIFDQEYPTLFGALLDAVAGGIRLWPQVKLSRLSRMADIDRWGEAVARGLGWPDGTFVDAYHANRRLACAGLLEEVPVAAALASMLAIQPQFQESPTQLFELLGKYRPKSISAASWPSSPSALSKLLRRLAPQLREVGIVVVFTQAHHGRTVFVGRIREVGQNAPK